MEERILKWNFKPAGYDAPHNSHSQLTVFGEDTSAIIEELVVERRQKLGARMTSVADAALASFRRQHDEESNALTSTISTLTDKLEFVDKQHATFNSVLHHIKISIHVRTASASSYPATNPDDA